VPGAIPDEEAEQLFRRHAPSFPGSIPGRFTAGIDLIDDQEDRALSPCAASFRLVSPCNVEQYFFGRERGTEVLTLSDGF